MNERAARASVEAGVDARRRHAAVHGRVRVRVRRRVELARVGVVGGVLELAVRAQVVGARVGGAAQRALEAAREVHVVVVADVRHHLAAQLAAVQVERARHALERQPHVPALRACATTDPPLHTTFMLIKMAYSPSTLCVLRTFTSSYMFISL